MAELEAQLKEAQANTVKAIQAKNAVVAEQKAELEGLKKKHAENLKQYVKAVTVARREEMKIRYAMAKAEADKAAAQVERGNNG